MKSTLKSNRNHTPKQAIRLSTPGAWAAKPEC
jgi:hypothetical protein